ncbi:carboxypeptidase-like regulatory domain-containing protein, partial [Candidatus Bathyarchaeota archaeon]|nr:carboxypeptidase-like regulatory domain-containing protein [Candidatus Bathyarchaeota archaeon]
VLSTQGSSYSVKASFDVRVVTINTSPIPLQVDVDGIVYQAPQLFAWEHGSNHTIMALSPQGNDPTIRYSFSNWSDGGNQTHMFRAGSSSVTLIANYLIQYYLNVSSQFGIASGQGWYSNGTFAHPSVDPAIFDASSGARYVFNCWSGDGSGSNLSLSDAIVMTSPKQITAEWKLQYQVILTFATKDRKSNIDPSQCEIQGNEPNGTKLTVHGYTALWLDDVNWTLRRVLWRGNDVSGNTTISYSPKALGTWEIPCEVQSVSFAEAFRDDAGRSLAGDSLRFGLYAPNGTLLTGLSTKSYLLQTGQYQIRNVTWMGVDVTRSSPTFDANNGAPVDNCSVYGLEVHVKDFLGLPASASITVHSLGGSAPAQFGETGLGGTYSLAQLPKGTYTIEASAIGGKDSKNVELTQTGIVSLAISYSFATIGIIGVTGIVLVLLVVLLVKRL